MSRLAIRPAPEELALVADIGGTNARFALAPLGDVAHAVETRHWRVCDYPSLAEAARAYLNEAAPAGGIRFGMIALAGPANDDLVKITNSQWHFSLSQMRRELGFDELFIVNDFAANSWGIAELRASQLLALGGPEAPGQKRGTFAVVGPGTGLGVSAILRGDAGTMVISSEGGHVDFAPVSNEEIEILTWLKARHHRVSYERLLCGAGLLNIYHAIGGSTDICAPEQVTARKSDDPDALRAIRIFCEVLGSFAGNTALTFGAWEGLYLAGDMLLSMREQLLGGVSVGASKTRAGSARS